MTRKGLIRRKTKQQTNQPTKFDMPLKQKKPETNQQD